MTLPHRTQYFAFGGGGAGPTAPGGGAATARWGSRYGWAGIVGARAASGTPATGGVPGVGAREGGIVGAGASPAPWGSVNPQRVQNSAPGGPGSPQ